MSVVIETTLGDITVDLFLSERPRACLNFLKLCKMKYYNYNLFHTISRGFIAQTGDPTGSRSGGESIFGVVGGPLKRYFEGENEPRIKHTKMGLISFVGNEERMVGSQFFITLGEDLTYLDEKHCVFGEMAEGFDVLEMINEVICDTDDRPYQDVRITHTVILDDPFPDPKRLVVPSRSPSPSTERLQGGRIAPDEEIDEMEGKTTQEISEMQAEREAKARATILEMVGDLPDAEMAPPENVLFVCKLNPVTNDDDLEIIFSRFGKIKSCEVIRDKKTGDSLQYAFVEFEDQKACENAYFKMDNVLIDDRRIHVDFSQSVSKVKWHGKGRGVTHYDEKGRKSKNDSKDIGKGNYKYNKVDNSERDKPPEKNRRSGTPNRDRSYRSTNRSGSPSGSRDSTNERRRFQTPEREESRSRRSRYKSRSPQYRNMSPPPRQNKSYSKLSGDGSRSPSRDKNKYSGSRDKYVSRKNYRQSPTPPRSRDYSRKDRSSYRDDKMYDRHKRVDKYSERRIPEKSKNTERDREKVRGLSKRNQSDSEEEYDKKKSKKKTKDSSDDSESDGKTKRAKKSKDYSDSSDSDGKKKRKCKKAKKKYSASSSDSEDYKKKGKGKKTYKSD